VYSRGGVPIYYHGSHELCITAVEPQNQSIYPKILPSSNYEQELRLLINYISTCLSWNFVLPR